MNPIFAMNVLHCKSNVFSDGIDSTVGIRMFGRTFDQFIESCFCQLSDDGQCSRTLFFILQETSIVLDDLRTSEIEECIFF